MRKIIKDFSESVAMIHAFFEEFERLYPDNKRGKWNYVMNKYMSIDEEPVSKSYISTCESCAKFLIEQGKWDEFKKEKWSRKRYLEFKNSKTDKRKNDRLAAPIEVDNDRPKLEKSVKSVKKVKDEDLDRVVPVETKVSVEDKDIKLEIPKQEKAVNIAVEPLVEIKDKVPDKLSKDDGLIFGKQLLTCNRASFREQVQDMSQKDLDRVLDDERVPLKIKNQILERRRVMIAKNW